MEELHRRAFDGEGEESEFRKELRGMLTPTTKVSDDMNAMRRMEMTQLMKAARNLRRCLSTSKIVPGGLRERLEHVLTELDALE
jgi:hypothetical protein